MEYCLEILKTKVNDYLSGKLEKKKLGKWGKEAYYDLLRGGYTEKDKIIIYPFLKTVSQIGLQVDEKNDIYPAVKEDIEFIQSVILGRKSYYFQIVVSVPQHIYKNYESDFLDIDKYEKFKILKTELKEYIENRDIKNEMLEHMKEIVELQNMNETILDLLQEQIVYLFHSLFDMEQKESMPQLSLYLQKPNNDLGLLKLKEYLECFVGERNFIVNVSYTKGRNRLSIMV